MDINLDPASEQFLDRLTETTRRMNRAQQQISSGKRFTAVSDDPDQVSTLLQTRLELETTNQVKQGLSRFKTEVDTAEGALSTADQIMDVARTIAAQAASNTTTAESRDSLATQVEALMERIVAISNTQVEGRYIFSGDVDTQPAYALAFQADATIVPYAAVNSTAVSTRQALAADGTRFAVARTAGEVFDGAGGSVLGALQTLRSSLRAGVPAPDTAVDAVSSAADYVSAQHAWYGNVQNKVNTAIDGASQRAVRYQTQLGALEDADMTQAIVDFTQAQFQRQAALQAHAQIPRKSLFDYLG